MQEAAAHLNQLGQVHLAKVHSGGHGQVGVVGGDGGGIANHNLGHGLAAEEGLDLQKRE